MEFLSGAAGELGLSGHEGRVSQLIARAFQDQGCQVGIDKLYNVTARMGDKGPKFYIAAHQDEIGLMATKVEDDGCLRFERVGGVDVRILPGSMVTVHAKEGDLFGVVGTTPPHLLEKDRQDKAMLMKDMFIDLGLDGQTCRAKVKTGDLITLTGPLTKLQDGRWAGKTMDDRACVASMLEAARLLGRMNTPARVCFASTSQEEVGSRGATVSGWADDPDVAIAIDVTHGPTPGCEQWETFPLDKLTITVGPNMHKELNKRLIQAAKDNGVAYTLEPCGDITATDAEVTQITRSGVPTVLLSVPLKYMHTTVETLDEKVIRETGRLAALFIDQLARDWEEIKWY